MVGLVGRSEAVSWPLGRHLAGREASSLVDGSGRGLAVLALAVAALVAPGSRTQATEVSRAAPAPAWALKFSDPAAAPGSAVTRYFKDGTRATVAYTVNGLELNAPLTAPAIAHTVLWTKTRFAGDLRIEFDYKRLNVPRVGVNETSLTILSGWGIPTACRVDGMVHPLDIRSWPRPVATYDYYTHCMSNQSVSFDHGAEPRLTYRQNPGYHNRGTVVPPLLRTGALYRVTILRTGNTVATILKQGSTTISSSSATLLPALGPIGKSGYVGFRAMSGVRAAYRNIKIYTR